MKSKTNNQFICAVIICFAFIACNQDSKSGDTKTDTSSTGKTETSKMPEYDPAMDPLKVGAKFSKVLADTLDLKFYEVTLNPGDSVPMHTHPDHTVYVAEGGSLEVTLKDEAPQVFPLTKGMGLVFAAQTHSGKNVGTTTLKLIVTNIYRARN